MKLKLKYEVEIDTEKDPTYLVTSWMAAKDRGDLEEADRLFRKIPFDAPTLMAFKKLYGAGYIRRKGFNTEKADARYGADWLDKDTGPPIIKRKMF